MSLRCLVGLFVLGLVTTSAECAEVAEVIYHGGPIITISEQLPSVEALAVADGKILAVGPKAEVLKYRGDSTKLVDLQSRALVPGFLDAHGHFMNVGLQATVANALPAPDGQVNSIPDLQETIRRWHTTPEAKRIGGGKFLVGFGYDDAQLKEKRHPTRQDLDAVSNDLPVLAIHQSAHLGVLNSKGLELAGITADTPDPSGGVIRREADGKTPNGVLEEAAWFPVIFQTFYSAIFDGNEHYFMEAGQRIYTSFGFTTAQEGRANSANVAALVAAAESGLLKIDVAAYPDPFITKDLFESPWHRPDYRGHFRIGGMKLSLDGSVQGKTAWLTQPYLVPPSGSAADYNGYPAYQDREVFPYIQEAIQRKWQVLCHCNGDAAIDQFLKGLQSAGSPAELRPLRPVVIHAQTVREDQLDTMAEYGVIPSFFHMHTFYWGDWHVAETLGPERAARISPSVSAMKRKMSFTSHHDAPVALPNSIRILSSCVTRTSRSGKIIGPDQRISMLEALKALTLSTARQYGEEATKGSLEPGKLADLTILSTNPLTIPTERIMELYVVETIKAGETVYRRGE
jgi:predicted amidohydrolase YtcJ